ncbi:type 1 fimbrial protein [Salmonella enterica subsp. salamae]|nr:type 1 fimbrial protein [Salmonella enterica subsp. salamae serovar Sofia]EBS4544115.1 type 1 fimbrial protein [Salmonella enterica subsp. salamae serovar Sofia]
MRILNSGFYALLIAVYSAGGSVEAGIRLHGQAMLYGEVLASACSIALNDRYQSVAMGELPLRELQSGRGGATHDMVIRLDNCQTSGRGTMDQETDPAIRVRFDGLRGSQPGLFRTLGEARGVALQLSDERREIVYPGEYLPAVYQKAYNQQVLKYRIALVPDGERLTGGDYSAALRFSINYE